jgi:hypothetical protein
MKNAGKIAGIQGDTPSNTGLLFIPHSSFFIPHFVFNIPFSAASFSFSSTERQALQSVFT